MRPELLALIKSYVWFNTINSNGISVGQSLLRLKYYDFTESDCIKALNSKQSLSFVLSQIFFPWIKQRISCITKSQTIGLSIELMENVYKTLDLINSFVFLYYGKYRSLWERVCRIGMGWEAINQNRNSSEVYQEIMTRELLWNSFAEFLTFVLPLINFYRLSNTYNHFLRTFLFRSKQIDSNVEQRNSNDLKVCGICNQWPNDGHEIGCRHVFCYYCLMSNFISDQINGFTCNQCSFKIKSIESIKRVKISIF